MLIKTSRFKLLLLTGFFCISVTILMQCCGRVQKPAAIAKLADKLPEMVDYNLHVKPILSDKCFLCHGPDKNSQKAGLELATREGALAALKKARSKHAIVPGDLANSEVYHRIVTADEHEMMPPKASNRVLSDYEKAVLIKWIEQGAEYKPHWALIKPKKTPLPVVKNTRWPRNPIDYFVLNKLEEKGLTTSPEADKETLLRRVSLDLTGLPPTLAETDAFLADTSPNAYEKVVNRLLQSPQYGEKMAVDWLDLARYADTHGYTVDRYRPMWPWRDWVVQSFNRNRPFSQFITWQLAGDLLPKATREQRIATGFNRNHSQNMEGGIINEEFRVEYVADRTNTLGTAMLGMTVECARCHDHKFDPISQKDYYSLFAFFNNVDEAGQISWDDATPVPTLLLTEPKQDSLRAFLDTKIRIAENALTQTMRTEKPAFEQWRAKTGSTISFDARKGLQAHFAFDKLVNGRFVSSVNPKDSGKVTDPVLVSGKQGNAFQSNGDDVLNLGQVGVFNRSQPFSIGAWVNIPNGFKKGVILHKGQGDITFDFRGYFLNIRDGKAELLMAHTWPNNALIRLSRQPLPTQKWIQLTMTYDGSSRADGLKLYLDGRELPMVTEKDNLYKDIIWSKGKHFGKDQPGLQVGADMRGAGFKNGVVDELMVYNRTLSPPEVQTLAGVPVIARDETSLKPYYLSNLSPVYLQQQSALQQLRAERNRVAEDIPEIMVMEEMKTPRPTYVLKRGVYDAHGSRVHPDIPASILPFSPEFPRNRLGLAQWLLHPDNPLTARVVVNRYWQTYFGVGLQKSANNFGNQGGLPTHPELLDWLAVTFRESGGPSHGWNIKAMQKLIVLSATYRQSSRASREGLQKDPENTWLARGPSFRLTAEMIRDNALASSGLLSTCMGGPAVKPYQPEGLWAVNSATYLPDHGDDLYRRSLYTFWRRTNPPPSMNTFDAPSRSYCVVQRQKTSTPLQALILLNDPQFVEAARAIAERSFTRKTNLPDQLTDMFRLLTSRKPIPKELAILTRLYGQEYQKFRKSPIKMQGWLRTGEHPLPDGADKPAIAAGAVVASTVMNSEAFVMKH